MITITGKATQFEQQRNAEICDALGNRCIVLVGMMGCGKSAIGRITASALGLKFFDSDAEIERAADMSVAEIFEKFGEPEFRRGEERVIQRLLTEGPLVLALGGGAFISADTRRVIARDGLSVWLDADVDLLLSRVMRKPGKRPLLMHGNPRAKLAELLEQRGPVYAQADIKVTSSRSSKTKTRDDLLDALYRKLVPSD